MARIAKPRRRLRGEGSVYEKTRTWRTKDGQTRTKKHWVAVTAENRTTAKGKRSGSSRRFFTGATAAEAREARDAWLREHGKPVPREANTKPLTLREFSEIFLANRKENKRGNTYRDYESTLRNHILPEIGDKKIAELTDDQIVNMYKQLESKVSPSMRSRIHRVLRAVINYALESKVIRISPLATIRQNVPRHKPKPVIPLDDEEITRLLEAIEGNRLEALIRLALDSGARQGELFALEWPDIDFDKGTVYIQRAAAETLDGIVVNSCKTEKSRRSIKLSPETIRALRQRKREAMREGLGDCRLVFPTESGRISRENKYGPILSKSNFLKKTWEPLRKAAKITAKFHTLRHTCAVQLLRADVHPKVVQERLGHASITLTMDTYSAWIPSLQAKAAEAMGDMFTRLAPKRRGQKARAS